MSVCGHSDIRLTSPPVLMLWGIQGYLWLPYDLTEVIKLFGVTFKQKKTFFFSRKYFMSFLPHYCHSFRISVIPSKLLSFLPKWVFFQTKSQEEKWMNNKKRTWVYTKKVRRNLNFLLFLLFLRYKPKVKYQWSTKIHQQSFIKMCKDSKLSIYSK